MKQPPSLLDGAKVLCFCSLKKPVHPTGIHHIINHGQKVFPVNAAICQYENSPTIYRFYCDENWGVLTDFDYLSIEEATESVESAYKGAIKQFQVFFSKLSSLSKSQASSRTTL